jgi:hypothetical protein
MAAGKWVDSAQDVTVLGGCAGCRAWVPLLKSRPHHIPLSSTGAKDPLLWSGTESDPHVSKPTFRVQSDKVVSETSIGRLHGQKRHVSLGRPNQGQQKLIFGGP